MPQPMDYIVAFWILTVGTIIGSGVLVVAVIAGVSKLREVRTRPRRRHARRK